MDEPKRKRRSYQLSLRALLVMILVLSLPLGWIGWETEQTRQEQIIVAEIQSWGGRVGYHPCVGYHSWATPLFRRVSSVSLSNTAVTDDQLVHLKRLATLDYLKLVDTHITDAGLVHLKELSSLRELRLYRTQVTREAAVNLAQALPDCNVYH